MQFSPSLLAFLCEFTCFNNRKVAVSTFKEAGVAVEPVTGVLRACLESADEDDSFSLAFAGRS
jgi:hypothetical protein